MDRSTDVTDQSDVATSEGGCECRDTSTSGTCPCCNKPMHHAQSSSTLTSTSAIPHSTMTEIEIPPILNPDGTSISYNLDQSSEQNYRIVGSYNYSNCTGRYSPIRATLDYSYHSHYHPQRQRIQDSIVTHLLNRTTIKCSTTGKSCSTPHDGNWIVFTAGAFGAGKTHTIRNLSDRGRFPLQGFVAVDPDEIRRHLPEFHLYVEYDAEGAGEMTRKEAGYMSEILTEAALREGRNVLVDGSLRDAEWYAAHFDDLRGMHPKLKIAIFHVTAPREAIYENVKARSRVTGRVVPREKIEMALEAVPRSVKRLGPLADYFCELFNSPEEEDVKITSEGIGWEDFGKQWKQSCPPADATDVTDESTAPRSKL